MTESIEVRESWGAVLAIAVDNAGTTTRYWFDEVDGELIPFAEVVELPSGRHYVEEHDMLVPDRVERALSEAGYECS